MGSDKVRIQCDVDKDTANRLRVEADQNTRKLGPHSAHILKQYAKELPKPYVSKQEYGG